MRTSYFYSAIIQICGEICWADPSACVEPPATIGRTFTASFQCPAVSGFVFQLHFRSRTKWLDSLLVLSRYVASFSRLYQGIVEIQPSGFACFEVSRLSCYPEWKCSLQSPSFHQRSSTCWAGRRSYRWQCKSLFFVFFFFFVNYFTFFVDFLDGNGK